MCPSLHLSSCKSDLAAVDQHLEFDMRYAALRAWHHCRASWSTWPDQDPSLCRVRWPRVRARRPPRQVAISSALRFVESHTRHEHAAREAILKLRPELEEIQGKLEATVAVMKVKAEKITVDAIVAESTQRVKEAEEASETGRRLPDEGHTVRDTTRPLSFMRGYTSDTPKADRP